MCLKPPSCLTTWLQSLQQHVTLRQCETNHKMSAPRQTVTTIESSMETRVIECDSSNSNKYGFVFVISLLCQFVSVCLWSVCWSVCWSICWSVWLNVCIFHTFCLSFFSLVFFTICPPGCLLICPFMCVFLNECVLLCPSLSALAMSLIALM